ncbi:MAG: ribosome silencing factor [Rhodospirillales bacterium]|nr:ribosome silencing factor [Alphaproteobacteria bacterium]USO03228.1 MAG: ribosome silencing factor [Rhodospirillales bacterium]
MLEGLDPSALKDLITRSLDSDKALDIEVIDLTGQSALCDYMVIASGTSSRQIIAMAEKLKERLHARHVDDIKTEGLAQGDWVVLDTGDVIVHLFRPEVRAFYALEKMWNMPLHSPSLGSDHHQSA